MRDGSDAHGICIKFGLLFMYPSQLLVSINQDAVYFKRDRNIKKHVIFLLKLIITCR
jgi:hypothetical protein